eukprot:TRINITY_DN5114_c0_g6_i1.p1 TRINITY_DN5114_c0_g6~~TRINITY_DN5114_c0_g6_i1.p1  ORF type:complete len:362 (-),score=62.51 TRINITY_DN5114_c0_g6_i1:224-1309(-)
MSSFSQVVTNSCRRLIRPISVLTDVLAQDYTEHQLESAKNSVRQEVEQFLHYLEVDSSTPHTECKHAILQATKNLQYDLQDVGDRFVEAPNKQEFLVELRATLGGYLREISAAAKTVGALEESERRVTELLTSSKASLHQCLQAIKLKDNETFSYELRCIVASLGKLSQIDTQSDDRIKQLLRSIFANAKDFFNADHVFSNHPLHQDLTQLGIFVDQLLEQGGGYYENDTNNEYNYEEGYDGYDTTSTDSGKPTLNTSVASHILSASSPSPRWSTSLGSPSKANSSNNNNNNNNNNNTNSSNSSSNSNSNSNNNSDNRISEVNQVNKTQTNNLGTHNTIQAPYKIHTTYTALFLTTFGRKD